MLDPTDFVYRDAIVRAYNFLGVPVPDVLPPLRLPRVITGLTPDRWVDPHVWHTNDPIRISQSVFDRVGHRPPAIAARTDDDILPTRAIFLTTAEPIDYANMDWPCGIPPLVCYTIESVQQVHHYHTILIFNYYSNNVDDLVQALGIEPISATRVKTDYRRTRKYMELQSVRIIDDVVNRAEALEFQDYLRCGMTRANVLHEARTLGNPAIFNRLNRRRVEWRPPGFVPEHIDVSELQHVWDGDVYVSPSANHAASDYRGQTFVCYPDGPNAHIDLPRTAGAYCILGVDDQVP
jgi:hypothetical protein